MKVRKTCFQFLLAVLTTLALCSCTRSAPPVESYQAAGQETAGSENITDKDGQNQAGNSDKPERTADPKEVQAAFDEFTDRVFSESMVKDPLSLHFMLRAPESYGITIPEMKFQTVSRETLLQSLEEDAATRKELESFEPSLLTSDQLFTYKMLQDTLETEELTKGLELHYQPLSPVIGVQAQLPVLLAEYAFYDRKDVDRYLELLSQIDVYYGELADYEKEMAAAGLAPSDTTIDRILQSCKDYLIRPENSFLTETFSSRLEDVPGLTEDEKTAYKQKHLTILKEHFIPAYTNLSTSLEALKGQGKNDKGLCYYDKGKEYYEYLVASLTGTDSSVEELKTRIEKRLGSDMAQITVLVQNNPELQEQINGSGITLTDPVEILNHLREQIKTDFPALEDSSFEVKHVPKALESSLSPAFFLVPPLDSENTNVIYINDKASEQQNLYTILAHEGYPGHLYQSVYFNRTNKCPLRRILDCGGYSEGWGLYCELYSYSFDNGLSENLQKLMMHSEASIYALYALLDIHVHYDGWDQEKMAGFLGNYYGISDPEVISEMFQALIDNPGNYLKYYTGYLEICTLKDAAAEALGDRFNIKAFHKFILDMDGAPFRVIKPYFQTWLLTYDVTG